MDNHIEEKSLIEPLADWSDATVDLHRLSVKLNDALNLKNYKDAIGFAAIISNNMSNLIGWAERKIESE